MATYTRAVVANGRVVCPGTDATTGDVTGAVTRAGGDDCWIGAGFGVGLGEALG